MSAENSSKFELSQHEETRLEWKIKNFFSLFNEQSSYEESPIFIIGEKWFCLKMELSHYDDFFRIRVNSEMYREWRVEYEIGVKKIDGRLYYVVKGHLFEGQEKSECHPLVRRSEFQRRNSELVPLDNLTIVCTLRREISPLIHLDKAKCKKLKNYKILSQDYKKVLLEGNNYDLTLKTDEKEFRVHRDVMSARSQVFQLMLKSDMKESISGVVYLPDIEPQVLEQFLLYVYTGKVENLDEKNVYGLYYAASKYDVMGLQEECCDFIKKCLSPSTICEIIQFALNQHDSALLNYCKLYFVNNAKDILCTTKWISFMKSNPDEANNLFIKFTENANNMK